MISWQSLCTYWLVFSGNCCENSPSLLLWMPPARPDPVYQDWGLCQSLLRAQYWDDYINLISNLVSFNSSTEPGTYLCFFLNKDVIWSWNWVWFQGSLYGGKYELLVAFDNIIQILPFRLSFIVNSYFISWNQIALKAHTENLKGKHIC